MSLDRRPIDREMGRSGFRAPSKPALPIPCLFPVSARIGGNLVIENAGSNATLFAHLFQKHPSSRRWNFRALAGNVSEACVAVSSPAKARLSSFSPAEFPASAFHSVPAPPQWLSKYRQFAEQSMCFASSLASRKWLILFLLLPDRMVGLGNLFGTHSAASFPARKCGPLLAILTVKAARLSCDFLRPPVIEGMGKGFSSISRRLACRAHQPISPSRSIHCHRRRHSHFLRATSCKRHYSVPVAVHGKGSFIAVFSPLSLSRFIDSSQRDVGDILVEVAGSVFSRSLPSASANFHCMASRCFSASRSLAWPVPDSDDFRVAPARAHVLWDGPDGFRRSFSAAKAGQLV